MSGLPLTTRILNFSIKTVHSGKQFRNIVTEENPRVRFAPSPTGFIHLGGLRTALYNHFFAKSKNGSTVIRIEDTDQTRIVKGAAERIIEDLKWCGINFDEGPYFQSERRELYQKHAKLLVDSGEAYYCFCSQRRLDLLRRELLKMGEISKYDNKCRYLSNEEVETKLKNNESYCIRFKLNDSILEFEDMIFGHYHCNLAKLEGDPVILKADGFPTYHLANVVDDHLMQISHVLRGSEWLVSTIKHLLMFKAFKWKPPQYGHLPLLLNSDGTKFSKRQNDLQIGYFRDNGIFPNALINLVTRAGGGFDIEHWKRDDKNFTLEELVKMFDITKVHKFSCKLPDQRLLDTNRLEIKRMFKNEKDRKMLFEEIRTCVKKHFNNSNIGPQLNLSDSYISRVLDLSVERIFKIEDLLSPDFRFMWVMPEYKFTESGTLTQKKMEELIIQLPTVDWHRESINVFLKDFAKHYNMVYKELMGTLRLILTSCKDGPSVAEILILLGKEDSLQRLKMSLEK